MLWDFLPWLLEEVNFRLWWWLCITPHKLLFLGVHCITCTGVFAFSSKSNRSSVTSLLRVLWSWGSLKMLSHRWVKWHRTPWNLLLQRCLTGSELALCIQHSLPVLAVSQGALYREPLRWICCLSFPCWGLLTSWVTSKCCWWVFECICLASAWIKNTLPSRSLLNLMQLYKVKGASLAFLGFLGFVLWSRYTVVWSWLGLVKLVLYVPCHIKMAKLLPELIPNAV